MRGAASLAAQRIHEVLAAVLAAIVLRPLRAVLNALFPPSEYDGLSPAVCCKAALQFATTVLANSNNTNPAGTIAGGRASLPDADSDGSGGSSSASPQHIWLTTGFSTAKQEAVDAQSLLLVALHSPLHPKSKPYLRKLSMAIHNLLSTEAHIKAVGYSIQTAQGLHLSHIFSASSYPFVALVQPPLTSSSNSSSSAVTKLNLLLRAEGPALVEYNVDHLASIIQACLTRHQVQVAEMTSRRLQQQEETELRRIQDEEYRLSLEADQEREREERRRREEALRAEQEALRAEQRQLERYRAAQDLLRDSDDAMASGGTERPTNIRFVLPSGAKLNHKFHAGSPVAVLFAYLFVHFRDHGVPMGRIGLSTSFPKQSLDENDPRTLCEAQLTPQAVLMVQDLDA
jgi:FAS-associated factor 2